MTKETILSKLARIDGLNYALTNHIPRRLASRLVGSISHSENPLVRTLALWTWQRFANLDLSDAERTDFRSMHDCFTRRLKPGARPINPDPAILVSPCDSIVGASGQITRGKILQVKNMEYALADLLGDATDAANLEGGRYITLRLTSAMYHRFHAPCDLEVQHVRHIFGDRWNVNPPTLRRIARLFCRNERVVVRCKHAATGEQLTIVAVAAILVSGIRLGFLTLGSGRAPIRQNHDRTFACRKGEEMGWFEHGSTLIVLTSAGMQADIEVGEGDTIKVGQAIIRQG